MVCFSWYSGKVIHSRSRPTKQKQQTAVNAVTNLNRIEPCLAEARAILEHIRITNSHPRQHRFCSAFTALADGDTAVGLLAYYLWRRRSQK
jgi:hypothetical protein